MDMAGLLCCKGAYSELWVVRWERWMASCKAGRQGNGENKGPRIEMSPVCCAARKLIVSFGWPIVSIGVCPVKQLGKVMGRTRALE